MGIDSNSSSNSECFAENDFCGFSTDTRQSYHLIKGLRQFTAIVDNQQPGAFSERLGLVPEKARGANHLFDLHKIGLCNRLRCGPATEEFRSHQIDANIGALRREHRRGKELPGCLIIQFTLGIRIELLQTPSDLGRTLFSGDHSLKALPPMNSLRSEVWGTSSGNTDTTID